MMMVPKADVLTPLPPLATLRTVKSPDSVDAFKDPPPCCTSDTKFKLPPAANSLITMSPELTFSASTWSVIKNGKSMPE